MRTRKTIIRFDLNNSCSFRKKNLEHFAGNCPAGFHLISVASAKSHAISNQLETRQMREHESTTTNQSD